MERRGGAGGRDWRGQWGEPPRDGRGGQLGEGVEGAVLGTALVGTDGGEAGGRHGGAVSSRVGVGWRRCPSWPVWAGAPIILGHENTGHAAILCHDHGVIVRAAVRAAGLPSGYRGRQSALRREEAARGQCWQDLGFCGRGTAAWLVQGWQERGRSRHAGLRRRGGAVCGPNKRFENFVLISGNLWPSLRSQRWELAPSAQCSKMAVEISPAWQILMILVSSWVVLV